MNTTEPGAHKSLHDAAKDHQAKHKAATKDQQGNPTEPDQSGLVQTDGNADTKSAKTSPAAPFGNTSTNKGG